MVSIPDSPEPDAHPGPAGSLLAGALVVLAMLGLWWVQIQQRTIQEVASSTFQMPTGRWILWSLTLVAIGLCFALAVAAGSGWRRQIGIPALLWGLIPLAMVLSFHLSIAGVTMPRAFVEVMVGIQMQVSSAVAVGVFLAGLLAPILPTPQPPAPEDASLPE